jgi:hypothetical protein
MMVLDYIRDALGFVHPAFAVDSRSLLFELYHQLRKLWDKAIPVAMGLGHLKIRISDRDSIEIIRMGEGGVADENLAEIFSGVPKPQGCFGCVVSVNLENVPPIPGVAVLVLDRGRVRDVL